jgi:hypothetical protein
MRAKKGLLAFHQAFLPSRIEPYSRTPLASLQNRGMLSPRRQRATTDVRWRLLVVEAQRMDAPATTRCVRQATTAVRAYRPRPYREVVEGSARRTTAKDCLGRYTDDGGCLVQSDSLLPSGMPPALFFVRRANGGVSTLEAPGRNDRRERLVATLGQSLWEESRCLWPRPAASFAGLSGMCLP